MFHKNLFYFLWKILGHAASLNDIYYVSEIDEIRVLSYEQSTFAIKVSSDNGDIVMAHSDMENIVKVYDTFSWYSFTDL